MIGGHGGYLTVGLYEDGSHGGPFITMAREGSTISGLMNSFATAIELLQVRELWRHKRVQLGRLR
jgi:ribonucleoside-diphosphate reductase alpha chain